MAGVSKWWFRLEKRICYSDSQVDRDLCLATPADVIITTCTNIASPCRLSIISFKFGGWAHGYTSHWHGETWPLIIIYPYPQTKIQKEVIKSPGEKMKVFFKMLRILTRKISERICMNSTLWTSVQRRLTGVRFVLIFAGWPPS